MSANESGNSKSEDKDMQNTDFMRMSRRSFIEKSTIVGAMAVSPMAAGSSAHSLLPALFTGAQEETLEWSNWSGSVNCEPGAIERPASEADIVSLVRRAQSSARDF